MKRKVPRSLIGFGILTFILAFIWTVDEVSSAIYTNGREPDDIGYVVWYEGTVYFVKGDGLTASDFENFSYDDIIFRTIKDPYSDEKEEEHNEYSKKFRDISILANAEIDMTVKRIKSGDNVAIWYNKILESYPGQIQLIRIKKLD